MHRAAADERRQLVAELLDPQRALDDLGMRLGEREDARQPDVVRGGEQVQVRRVVLQVAAVDEQLAQQLRALADLDAQRGLERLDRRERVVRRADAADARRDERRLVEPPARRPSTRRTARARRRPSGRRVTTPSSTSTEMLPWPSMRATCSTVSSVMLERHLRERCCTARARGRSSSTSHAVLGEDRPRGREVRVRRDARGSRCTAGRASRTSRRTRTA